MNAKLFLLASIFAMQACGSAEFSGDTSLSPNASKVNSNREKGIGSVEDDGKLPEGDPSAGVDKDPIIDNADATPKQEGGNSVSPNPGGNDSLSEAVDFGDGTVFRLGDGVVRQTECLDGISGYSESFKSYSFEFEVKEVATKVQLQLDKLCGIDTNTNTASILTNSASEIQKATLVTKQSNIQFQQVELSPGKYKVEVSSNMIPDGAWKGQFDDFLVGSIKLKANKKIIPGAVKATK